ncbi:hypothetical protein BGZ76_001119 [Entomortierella beljakovae]|nr:hypothetical protein BGZ76_001119 [Entomortierella beljakovae]
MVHKYDLSLYTYFDVKIVPEAASQVLESTLTAASAENGTLAGVEYVGHVGELDNHLLYRVPKNILYENTNRKLEATPPLPHSSHDDELEEQRNKQIADAISAVQGVVHVDVQTLRQRIKRDEL